MIKLGFDPCICKFVSGPNSYSNVIAIADTNSSVIHVVKTEATGKDQVTHLTTLHKGNVASIDYLVAFNVVISSDSKGIISIWDSSTHKFPQDNTCLKFKS